MCFDSMSLNSSRNLFLICWSECMLTGSGVFKNGTQIRIIQFGSGLAGSENDFVVYLASGGRTRRVSHKSVRLIKKRHVKIRVQKKIRRTRRDLKSIVIRNWVEAVRKKFKTIHTEFSILTTAINIQYCTATIGIRESWLLSPVWTAPADEKVQRGHGQCFVRSTRYYYYPR